ncbi:site-specific integrase [Acinetobacter sp. 187]|uniref:tyrosine-type recombinase/integrase n=1 Tax=Acinetobacter lanii TaxID=2715163 RepID=UPI00140B5522|nr:site-specific integrase [Acinetobacter lanii]NHC05099.1 site-specific integrase [Acinetobacter lanii]
MAILEKVSITPMVLNFSKKMKEINWVEDKNGYYISKIPQIFFDNGEPWLAANAYAVNKLESVKGNNLKTIHSNMNHLKAYACWLEENNLDWRHFPNKKYDRCLFRYRGYLIEQRQVGLLSPSTVSARMSAIILFYRWAQTCGWIERQFLWEDKLKIIKFYNPIGFSRTMSIVSSELSIPNRRTKDTKLESGLLPLSNEDQSTLLNYLYKEKMIELYFILMIGFFTGARSETIRSLRLSNIENAVVDPTTPSMMRVAVGPGTFVQTKFNVKGDLLFPSFLINELKRYAYCARRLRRQIRAKVENRTYLFLSIRGNSYSETSFTKLISDLRERLNKAGLTQFKSFKFHQTRATFGTQLMKLAIKTLPNPTDAIVFVRDAMLHSHESTTWKYLKFIEKEPIKKALSDEFFYLYTGSTSNAELNVLINEIIYD